MPVCFAYGSILEESTVFVFVTGSIFKKFSVSCSWYWCLLNNLQIASMRLAYQDLSLQQKKEQEKLKHVDPVKAQQIERLGMGFASRT